MNVQEFAAQQPRYFHTLQQQAKSVHTLAAYQRDLAQLNTLLAAALQGAEAERDLKRQDFVSALKKLSQQNLSETSLARKLSAWRQYGAWLVQHGLWAANPLAQLKAPRRKETLPKALPQEPLNHLLDQTPDQDDPLAVRDHAVYELLYGSGLRLAELHGLNLGDVLLDAGWVSVNGKGGKQRQVPLSRKSIAALQAYLPQRMAVAGENALFTNRHGRRLGMRQIQKRLAEWAVASGGDQHISPHMMRHSYASHLLQGSRDIRAVQELLGHSSLSTTQIYTKLDLEQMAKVYDDAHPRAKRKTTE